MSTFNLTLDKELRLVRVIIHGEIFQKDGEKIIIEARTAAAENSFNLLYDMRDATTTVHFSSWFQTPRTLEIFQAREQKFVKTAVIVSPNDKALEDYKFYEIVSGNLGLQLRIFFEEKDAMEWINGED